MNNTNQLVASELPTSVLSGKLPLLRLALDEPQIDPAELDLYFPQLGYTSTELDEMYQAHLAEGGQPNELAPLPELQPITNRPQSINWNLFARPVSVVAASSNHRMKFLTVEDQHGTRYETSALNYTIADVKVGSTGFIVPTEEEDVWIFHGRLPA